MISKDKTYVQEATCAKFQLSTIKEAYELLFNHANPEKAFSYRGPNQSTIREKSVHAFNEIYRILQKLDSDQKSPIIACPSEELRSVLPANGQIDFIAIDDRLRAVESDLNKLRYLEKSYNDLKGDVRTLQAAKQQPPTIPHTGIHPVTTNRIIADSNHPMHIRSRTSSVSSSKRGRESGDSDENSDNEDNPFRLSKYQEKKSKYREKRQKLTDDKNTYSKSLIEGIAKPNTTRRPAVWGKSTVDSDDTLSGAVPDLFIFNVVERPSEEKVKNFLTLKGISILEVKQMSHEDAYKRSFRVKVSTHTDYDKVMSGEFLPRGVAVKRFIYGRQKSNPSQWNTTSMSHPHTSDKYNSNLIELKNLLKSSLPSEIPNKVTNHSISSLMEEEHINTAASHTEVAKPD